MAYHLPTADICLWSPQTYFQARGGCNAEIVGTETLVRLTEGDTIHVPYEVRSNLPLIFRPAVLDPAAHVLSRELFDLENIWDGPRLATSVADETNQNLTEAQKELLIKHWTLGHAHFAWIQKLMREVKVLDDSGESVASRMPPSIPKKHPSASKCVAPMCAAC